MGIMKSLNQCICEAIENQLCEELSMEKCEKTYELASDILDTMVDVTQRYEKTKKRLKKDKKKGWELIKAWKKEEK